MVVVEAVTLVAVLAVIVAGAFRLLRPASETSSGVEAQRDEAHQLLVELQIRDEMLVFLPSPMRDKIDRYMAKYGRAGS